MGGVGAADADVADAAGVTNADEAGVTGVTGVANDAEADATGEVSALDWALGCACIGLGISGAEGNAAFCFGYPRVEDLGDNVVTGVVLATGDTGDTGDAGEALDLGVGVEGLLSAKGPEFAAKAFKSSLLKSSQMKAMGERILSVRKVFAHEFRET